MSDGRSGFMAKINVRGIPFDNVTMAEAVDLAEAALETDGVSVVVTPNAEIAEMCLEDASVKEAILSADIILPDGAGVVMASEILDTPLKEKVAGVDFGERVLALAAKKGYGVFLLGDKPGVAEVAAQRLSSRYPDLRVVGRNDGYFEKSGAANDDVIEKINASGAQILFVCLGAPLQEKWIATNRHALTTVRLAACLGGSLDVYAGTAKRAPAFFIKMRMEWLYRLIREPRRLGRMMKLPRYIMGAKKESRKKRKNGL